MSSSAAGAGSPSLKAFHSETCSQTPFGGLQSTKVDENEGGEEDNDGGRGQGCWIMASVVEEQCSSRTVIIGGRGGQGVEIWVKFRFFVTFRIVSEWKLEKDGRRASMEDVRARIVKEW